MLNPHLAVGVYHFSGAITMKPGRYKGRVLIIILIVWTFQFFFPSVECDAYERPAQAQTASCASSPTDTRQVRRRLQRGAKPLAHDSVLMLIGDLPAPGASSALQLSVLRQRLRTAAVNRIDTVVLVCETRHLEESYTDLDGLLNMAMGFGIGVVPRIIVNSNSFKEYDHATLPFPETIPAFTNADQLKFGVALLRRVILHLEEFSCIVGYQVEWGHYGESWTNAPVWDSPASVNAFLAYLQAIAPEFSVFTGNTMTDWAWGQVMVAGECWPIADPRRNPLTVAEYYWYQKWRNDFTRTITWTFRSTAHSLTTRPILGFSYVVGGPDGVIGHAYNAAQFLDIAYSDWNPGPGTAHQDFIRDAYPPGFHFAELDFDTPYFALSRADEAISRMYARGIVPVIFYPHWSAALHDSDIPNLVSSILKHKSEYSIEPADVLVVFGQNEIGLIDSTNTSLLADGGRALTSENPPGLVTTMLNAGILVDVASPVVYSAALGNRYKAVVSVTPLDSGDRTYQSALSQTTTPVFIAHPSFLVGTPTSSSPTATTGAYCESWNQVEIAGRGIGVKVWGREINPGMPDPQIRFLGSLAHLGLINGYVPNRNTFSIYQGSFDEILARAEFSGATYPTIARVGNIFVFGLAINLFDDSQRIACQSAFLNLLRTQGVSVPHQLRE